MHRIWRQKKSVQQWGVLFALALLALLPTIPYLVSWGDGVPRTNDLFPHLHRAYAFGRTVELTGQIWPRWSPYLVHGYGYPVFNYFPSLTHWLIIIIHWIGLPITTAYRVAVYLHMFATAVASYQLGKAMWKTRAAGWLTAAVYLYSPYLLYDNIVRGSLPETQALALLPWLVLALYRMTEPIDNSPTFLTRLRLRSWPFFATAVLYAAMILSHQGVTLQVSSLLGIWLLWRAYFMEDRFSLRVQGLIPPVFALFLGGLLTAFFSLPALLEIDLTRAQLSISQGYTYETNFLQFGDMLEFPTIPADTARVNPPVVRALPVVAAVWVLLVFALRWTLFTVREKRAAVGWGGLALLGTWLVTPSSSLLWLYFPILRYTLFPWRALAMVSLATAVLAGLAARHSHINVSPRMLHRVPVLYRLPPRYISQLPLILFVFILALFTVPWLYPSTEPTPEVLTQYDVNRAEVPPFLVGTTTLGEFLPVTVTELPNTAELQAQLANEREPDRLLPMSGVEAIWHTENPLDARYTITAETDTALTYRQFAYAGWQATLNGRSAEIVPSDREGLITIMVPAGTSELHIFFGTTPIRQGATAVSWGSLIVLLAITGAGVLRQTAITDRPLRDEAHVLSDAADTRVRVNPAPLTLSLIVVWVFIFTAVVETPVRRNTLQPDRIVGTPARTPLDYAGDLRLVTYEQSAEQIAADETVQITLYWQPLRKIYVDYVVGVQIIDEMGQMWHAGEPERPSDWRFVAGDEPWPLDSYRLDPFELSLLDGTPPGAYQWRVGLVNRQTGQTIAAHDMGQLVVTEPVNGTRPLEANMTPHNETDGGITLLASAQDRTAAQPGDPMRLATLWEVDQVPPPTDQFVLQLRDPSDAVLFEQNVAMAPTYPVDRWKSGDRLRRDVTFRLPASLPSGVHTWYVTWREQTAVALKELEISAPDRVFDRITPEISVQQALGDQVVLLGADLLDNEEVLTLDLYWQATAEMETSYRVFVHLLDSNGQIVAQVDGEPASWARPTTGWLPPEIVQDTHQITLPAEMASGEYTLLTGLYDPQTGVRLSGKDGADTITISLIGR